MAYIGTTDYNLEVLKGSVGGSAMVSIIGHDEMLTTTRTTVHPTGTTLNLDQSAIDRTAGTPAVVTISSTSGNDAPAGSGLLTLRVFGLDTNGDATSEDLTTNGTTAVIGAVVFSAVTGWRGLTWGATTWNEGTIWVGTGVVTSGVPSTKYFAGEVRANKGMSAYYVVPLGKSLYLRNFTLMVSTSNKDVEVFVETSVDGVNWITEAVFGMEPSEFNAPITATPALVTGTHLRIEAKSSASGTATTVILAAELIDD